MDQNMNVGTDQQTQPVQPQEPEKKDQTTTEAPAFEPTTEQPTSTPEEAAPVNG